MRSFAKIKPRKFPNLQNIKENKPAFEISVRFAIASNEYSDESVQMRRIIRPTQTLGVDRKKKRKRVLLGNVTIAGHISKTQFLGHNGPVSETPFVLHFAGGL